MPLITSSNLSLTTLRNKYLHLIRCKLFYLDFYQKKKVVLFGPLKKKKTTINKCSNQDQKKFIKKIGVIFTSVHSTTLRMTNTIIIRILSKIKIKRTIIRMSKEKKKLERYVPCMVSKNLDYELC